MSEIKDPLDEVFIQQTIVPDLKWMIEEMPKMETIGESMIMLREMIGDEVLISSKHDLTSNTRLREILLLTGKERNPLRDRLDNIEDSTHLKYVFRAKMNKISFYQENTADHASLGDGAVAYCSDGSKLPDQARQDMQRQVGKGLHTCARCQSSCQLGIVAGFVVLFDMAVYFLYQFQQLH
jgi:hypothetical protein